VTDINYDHAIECIRSYEGDRWDAELALAREMSESIEVDHDEGPCAIGFKWDGLTYWFLIDETGCEWDADDPRETMIKSLLGQRDYRRASIADVSAICQWCKSSDCTPSKSPHCYCLDCGTPLVPCRCRPDCPGGNCYQPSCSEDRSRRAEADRDAWRTERDAEHLRFVRAEEEVRRLTALLAAANARAEWLTDLASNESFDRYLADAETDRLRAEVALLDSERAAVHADRGRETMRADQAAAQERERCIAIIESNPILGDDIGGIGVHQRMRLVKLLRAGEGA